MDRIKKRLTAVTKNVLNCTDPESDEAQIYLAQVGMLRECSKTWKIYEACNVAFEDNTIKKRLDAITKLALSNSKVDELHPDVHTAEFKRIQALIQAWGSFENIDVTLEEDIATKERDRKSSKMWNVKGGSLTTKIKLTRKQKQALIILRDKLHDKIALLGGSGSGKSFIEAYSIVSDTLEFKAPCLIARDKLVDLTQGMIDQIIPTILTLIAQANGQEKWETWTIDGLKFAKWTDKKTKLEFATGGYIRFAGLSARDLSESGSDKILSPSWFHVMLEEVSELEWETVEKIITRLRHNVDGQLNKLIMCENPPSVNHWSYRRFIEHKRTDGSAMSDEEIGQHAWMLMNPDDNRENLGDTYIRNLSQLSGANYERFYLGKFQETEQGEILKKMVWVDQLPPFEQWERIMIYTDPTPLTGKDYSEWADYKASVLAGLWDGKTFIIDIRMVRGSTMDMIDSIKQLWDISPNKAITDVWMEKKAMPPDFNQVLRIYQTRTGWMVPIQMDTRQMGDKKTAIESHLQPVFEAEQIVFYDKWRNTERGRQASHQILKFSRKTNKRVHDDIPDAIMRCVTKMHGTYRRRVVPQTGTGLISVKPGFISANASKYYGQN